MFRFLRISSIILLLFTGINALVAGLLFVLEPQGSLIGLTTDYIKHSPFNSYLIPGITLLLVIGIGSIFAAVQVIRKRPAHPLWIIAQAINLSGWIAVQIFMVHDFNLLHAIMGSMESCY